MKKKEAMEILRLIETVYSFCMTKDETVITWFNACENMDYDRVIVKLLHHLKMSPYPPTIAYLQDSEKSHFNGGRDGDPRLTWQDEYRLKA